MKAGDQVAVFATDYNGNLFIEGRAKLVSIIDDHRWRVRWDKADGCERVSERYVDAEGQDDPEKYVDLRNGYLK